MKRTSFLGGVVTVCLSCFALPVLAGLYGDFTGDNTVDLDDLYELSELWLVDDCCETASVDLDENCIVNFYEFSQFANNWMLHIPSAPTGLAATAGNAKVLLNWNDNPESDLVGYNIYRSITSGAGFAKINISLQTSSDYNDTTVTNGTTYYYVVTAVDTALNESDDSNEVSATPTPPAAPGQASSPNPANGATGVSITQDLSWTAGSGATSRDVYFGTAASPPQVSTSQTATTFDTGTMANNTTYYWRINEKNAGGTTTGIVWSFTTIVAAPGQATSPTPSTGATGVSITQDLSWTAGSGAISHDVYFGTAASPPQVSTSQTATTFDTGTMLNNTTYYWRINEKNAGGTTTGAVWSFTTIVAPPGPPGNPNPTDMATNVAVNADLSWTIGSGATSHDVYFGTAASPPLVSFSQTAATYDTGTMANNTTYYWRINEKNAGGTTTGAVWSFTTIVAAPGAATSPTPANSATGVSITQDLSWTAGSGATSRDVYFGTAASPPQVSTSQTATTFDTGTMSNNTTYYWRINEKNAGGTTTGTVWSFTTQGTPSNNTPRNLMVPPMAWDDTQIILIWSKPIDYSAVTDYRVYQNGSALGLSGRFDTTRAKLYYIVTGLTANTSYNFTVRSVLSGGGESSDSNTCTKATTAAPTILNIANAPYNASNNGTTKNTAAIQQAINDCPAGGVVLIPTGGTGYLSGAIFLKSNMTLKVDGTLIGAEGDEIHDYPQTSWRVPYYAGGVNFMGLVNAYNNYRDANTYPDPNGAGRPYILQNIRICGSGTISGDIHDPGTGVVHTHVGFNEQAYRSDAHLGDMITIKGVTNFYIGGWGTGTLKLIRPPEHTIFASYCNGFTLNALDVSTYDLHNADGIDLATTDTAYIFNSAFDTGDDCINMNAGQGLKGQDPNVGGGVPTQNVRVFDCTTGRGHGGYVIGSFTAAWVQDSLVEDCFFQNNETSGSNGIAIRMKTGQYNGGGGRRITCRDIRIAGPLKQGILLDSTYDSSTTDYGNGGKGQFRDNTFKNITITSTGETIKINGLLGTPHTNNIFDHITGASKAASLNYCTNSTFSYVTVSAWSPYTNCSGNINGGGNSPAPPF